MSALLVAILIFKSSGATDSDTQKVAAIQKRRYFSGAFNNPDFSIARFATANKGTGRESQIFVLLYIFT